MDRIEGWTAQPRDRLAEQVSAAAYGTVLVLAALPLVTFADVGAGWGLITGVGVATYVAHAYALVMGDHVRHGVPLDRAAVGRALRDGLPILAATVGPALALALARLDVLSESAALWAAVIVAVLQLTALGVLVGWAVTDRRSHWWTYGIVAAALGVVVVFLKLRLSH
jgi:hypothetical protein